MVRKLIVLTIAACAFFAAGAARAANITSCHPITASGSYSIPAGTTLSISSGDCLDIEAPNVRIAVNDHATIKGGGTGVGVHVLPGAPGFNLGMGIYNSITNFAIAFEAEASASIASFGGDCGKCDSFVSGTNVGVWFNNVQHGSLGQLFVSGGKVGCEITGGKDNIIAGNGATGFPSYIGCTSNSIGLEISNSTANILSFVSAGGPAEGIYLQNSTGNNFENVNGTAAGSGSGILIDGGAGNLIFSDIGKGGAYGIRIKANSISNTVTHSTGSGTTYDMFQGSPTLFGGGLEECWDNLWLNNTFNTANQQCIQ